MSTDGYEDYVLKERRRRYEKEFARNHPNPNRTRSELGNPVQHYGRNGDFYRPRSGRNSAFQEYRETSSSDEMELVAGPAHGYSSFYGGGSRNRRVDKWKFSEAEIAFFMTIGLHPDHARRILRDDPPPAGFYELEPVVKAGYLFYHEVYHQYFQREMSAFTKRFYREFYKYIESMTEEEALYKICEHTRREYERNQQRIRALTLAEGPATPESRGSLPSYDDSDSFIMEPAAKEPLKFRTHHTNVRFAPGGRLLIVNPQKSATTVEIRYVKNLITDQAIKRNLEIIEAFKGPLLYNETQPHTLLPFIERQIQGIYNSDVYRGNPESNDTNDCLLIWRLLQMLVKQQGRVTGPDLAQLLIGNENDVRATVSRINAQQATAESESDLAQCTYFLVRGCVDDAINSAVRQGCLFDALILAESLYADKPDKLRAVKASLMATRSAAHPLTTLNSVAAAKPVPLLATANTDDGRGWRVHVAILLANLDTPAAHESIYQLGLDLARREFDSAADFCFLAVSLLSSRKCFQISGQPLGFRQHVGLIKATLPDDEVHAARTQFGWSLLDFCATEIFEYTLRLANGGQSNPLNESPDLQKARREFAALLDELGGFAANVRAYGQLASGQPTFVAQQPFVPQAQPLQQPWPQYAEPQQFAAPSFFQPPQLPTIPQGRPVDHKAPPPLQLQRQPVQPPQPASPLYSQQPKIHSPRQTSIESAPVRSVSVSSVGSSDVESEAAAMSLNEHYVQRSFSIEHREDTPVMMQQQQFAHPAAQQPQVPQQSFAAFNAPAPQPVQQQRPMVQEQKPQQPAFFQQQPQMQQQQPQPMQMQQQTVRQPQLIQQRPAAVEQPAQPQKQAEKPKKSGGGWLGGVISKIIPGNNEMILPDDSKIPEEQRIRWDPNLGKYVGGIEEEEAPPPPPSIPLITQQSQVQQPAVQPNALAGNGVAPVAQPQAAAPAAQPAGLRSSGSIRKGPGRYYNPNAASAAAPASPSMVPNVPMGPPSFNFMIPTAADDGDAGESPFSQQTEEPAPVGAQQPLPPQEAQ
ncbi:Protein transport protein sec16 [Aphelenchoides fujianensis]|nr:Protein transport protein sec16 [Aphelenchoides fujianensis]KAI6243598.1 Protein transport protein sec16 [Aphelenchoides fujianensis]